MHLDPGVGATISKIRPLPSQRRLAGRAGDRPQPGPLDGAHRSGRAGGDHQDPPAAVLLPRRTAHPLGAKASPCICPSVGPGKTSSVALWHGCERFHSQPDGTPGVNADVDLVHQTTQLPRSRARRSPSVSCACYGDLPRPLRFSPIIHRLRGYRTPHSAKSIGTSPHLLLGASRSLVCPTSLHPFGGFGLRRRPRRILPPPAGPVGDA